mgnify:CR=1 FL=1
MSLKILRCSIYLLLAQRRVVKLQKDNGNSKYSATQYPNGTIVETKVTKRKE